MYRNGESSCLNTFLNSKLFNPGMDLFKGDFLLTLFCQGNIASKSVCKKYWRIYCFPIPLSKSKLNGLNGAFPRYPQMATMSKEDAVEKNHPAGAAMTACRHDRWG